MHNKAVTSPFSAYCNIYTVPNAIPMQDFFPVERTIARSQLAIGQQEKVILYGASNANRDYNKGLDLFRAALHKIRQVDPQLSVRVLVFGTSDTDLDLELPYPTENVGTISDDTTLRLMYSAADAFACPSRFENLANSIAESMACGCPAVAFDVGGNKDLIEPQRNGYLCDPEDTEQFGLNLHALLIAPNPIEMRHEAHRKIKSLCDSTSVAKQHIQIYEELLRVRHSSI